uniref:Uncharacterized protein n=1 Tax=Arundo donax TaxID=35708 RepID=A0A0A9DCL9_ARUDO
MLKWYLPGPPRQIVRASASNPTVTKLTFNNGQMVRQRYFLGHAHFG